MPTRYILNPDGTLGAPDPVYSRKPLPDQAASNPNLLRRLGRGARALGGLASAGNVALQAGDELMNPGDPTQTIDTLRDFQRGLGLPLSKTRYPVSEAATMVARGLGLGERGQMRASNIGQTVDDVGQRALDILPRASNAALFGQGDELVRTLLPSPPNVVTRHENPAAQARDPNSNTVASTANIDALRGGLRTAGAPQYDRTTPTAFEGVTPDMLDGPWNTLFKGAPRAWQNIAKQRRARAQREYGLRRYEQESKAANDLLGRQIQLAQLGETKGLREDAQRERGQSSLDKAIKDQATIFTRNDKGDQVEDKAATQEFRSFFATMDPNFASDPGIRERLAKASSPGDRMRILADLDPQARSKFIEDAKAAYTINKGFQKTQLQKDIPFTDERIARGSTGVPSVGDLDFNDVTAGRVNLGSWMRSKLPWGSSQVIRSQTGDLGLPVRDLGDVETGFGLGSADLQRYLASLKR